MSFKDSIAWREFYPQKGWLYFIIGSRSQVSIIKDLWASFLLPRGMENLSEKMISWSPIYLRKDLASGILKNQLCGSDGLESWHYVLACSS